MKNKNMKNLKGITIPEFMRDYCDVTNHEIYDGLSHFELSELLMTTDGESLKRISTAEISYEDILRGEIIMVSDTNNNTAPYVRPALYIDKVKRK